MFLARLNKSQNWSKVTRGDEARHFYLRGDGRQLQVIFMRVTIGRFLHSGGRDNDFRVSGFRGWGRLPWPAAIERGGRGGGGPAVEAVRPASEARWLSRTAGQAGLDPRWAVGGRTVAWWQPPGGAMDEGAGETGGRI